MKDENLDYCKHIRCELEKYYNGEVYRCPECDERSMCKVDYKKIRKDAE